ncbi:hypothetical protein [Paraburkholderia sp. MM5477-R1]|uniref:hypothetical protein n=1 Tax=Paraburkholderia sp. MM5477-R1 TaxID=2991062 RepID=UPI003D20B480
MELFIAGRLEEAAGLFRAELNLGDEGVSWMTDVIVNAMHAETLGDAGELAAIFAHACHGGQLTSTERAADRDSSQPRPMLSADKLRHDIEQLEYLRRHHIVGAEIDVIIANYEAIIARLDAQGRETRTLMSDEDVGRIGHVYSRIVHVRDTPRLRQALSPGWSRSDVEQRYLHHPQGIVVIDDFLTQDALDDIWRFCLESTVWLGNRYWYGRLGAFFLSGFNCPLLLQVAEEVRAALPDVIGHRHPLQQLWGFKYPSYLPPDSTIHADFAAVNVNFWITPDESNLDRSTGGLVIYDHGAPANWDFRSYNEKLDMIKAYLQQNRACATRIPYRRNRAVIFNSDLFHATDEMNFRPGYEDRRINITMLYGVRELDERYSAVSADGSPMQLQSGVSRMWRSPALLKIRVGG